MKPAGPGLVLPLVMSFKLLMGLPKVLAMVLPTVLPTVRMQDLAQLLGRVRVWVRVRARSKALALVLVPVFVRVLLLAGLTCHSVAQAQQNLPVQPPAQPPGLPSFEAVRAAHQPSDATLLDRHGTPIQTLRVDNSVRRGPWLALAEVSPALRNAIVFSEDRRFWAHSGVDWQALAASAWANAWNKRTRGASTLTMQLAGLLDDELARPAAGRSVAQKLGQVRRAQQLEARWSKAQILEAYLNRVPLRGELVGVSAAAQTLFGKYASGLDAPEAAVLAAMLRGPNATPARLERRACELLRDMQGAATPAAVTVATPAPAPAPAPTPTPSTSTSTSTSPPTVATAVPDDACAAVGMTLAQALDRRHGSLGGEQIGPHFMRQLARQDGRVASGLRRWVSHIDGPTQRVALSALRQQLSELRGRNAEDGAVLVLDNHSGEVLAWVGSSGPASQAAEVDAVLARRQPGSTLKPFVYALALQQRLITAASVLDDSPLQLAAGGALYQPQNYDHRFKGAVSVRQALADSLNIPAVRVGAMLGPDALFEALNRAGLRLSETAGYHGQALVLGSADVSLLDLTNAYRALAQRGRYSPVQWPVASGASSAVPSTALSRAPSAAPRTVASDAVVPAQSKALFTPAVAFVVADILADPAARAGTFGLDSPLVTRGWAAVKTGTSKDMRDNWCVGFSQRYTVGVWVGNASGAAMHGVSGVSGAAPVWRAVMAHLHNTAAGRSASAAPSPPAGLVAVQGEWFIDGTQPGVPTALTAAAAGRFGISSPIDGTVVVLDPDIPMAAQRMVFEGASGDWFVSGQRVGSGQLVRWLPRPGRHVLERRAAPGSGSAAGSGSVVDRVRFEVRAAPAARSVKPQTERTPAPSPRQ